MCVSVLKTQEGRQKLPSWMKQPRMEENFQNLNPSTQQDDFHHKLNHHQFFKNQQIRPLAISKGPSCMNNPVSCIWHYKGTQTTMAFSYVLSWGDGHTQRGTRQPSKGPLLWGTFNRQDLVLLRLLCPGPPRRTSQITWFRLLVLLKLFPP